MFSAAISRTLRVQTFSPQRTLIIRVALIITVTDERIGYPIYVLQVIDVRVRRKLSDAVAVHYIYIPQSKAKAHIFDFIEYTSKRLKHYTS